MLDFEDDLTSQDLIEIKSYHQYVREMGVDYIGENGQISSEVIVDYAHDKVMYENMYRANIRLLAEVEALRMQVASYNSICAICRAAGRPG